jgi:hypothetical protein
MPPIPGRTRYKHRSPETWELVRTAYMRGESAPVLARRFDVTVWNIYKKAMEEGWSRRALILAEAEARGAAAGAAEPPSIPAFAAPPPLTPPPLAPEPVPPSLEDDLPPAEAAERVAADAGRAALAGRYDEAQKLTRLAESLRRLAADAPPKAKPAKPVFDEDDEEWADDPRNPDRPLGCTMGSCAVQAIYKEAEEGLERLLNSIGEADSQDLIAWVRMAQAIGAPVEPEAEAIVEALTAENAQQVCMISRRMRDYLRPESS